MDSEPAASLGRLQLGEGKTAGSASSPCFLIADIPAGFLRRMDIRINRFAVHADAVAVEPGDDVMA